MFPISSHHGAFLMLRCRRISFLLSSRFRLSRCSCSMVVQCSRLSWLSLFLSAGAPVFIWPVFSPWLTVWFHPGCLKHNKWYKVLWFWCPELEFGLHRRFLLLFPVWGCLLRYLSFATSCQFSMKLLQCCQMAHFASTYGYYSLAMLLKWLICQHSIKLFQYFQFTNNFQTILASCQKNKRVVI